MFILWRHALKELFSSNNFYRRITFDWMDAEVRNYSIDSWADLVNALVSNIKIESAKEL